MSLKLPLTSLVRSAQDLKKSAQDLCKRSTFYHLPYTINQNNSPNLDEILSLQLIHTEFIP